MINLERLYISSTSVSSLDPLSGLTKLQSIYLDSTNVSDLDPLGGLEELESIYCDNTGITGTIADRFMAENPKILVVYESVALSRWWNNMSKAWQDIIRQMVILDPEPSKEQLHQAVKITELDISGNQDILDLSPVKLLIHLTRMDCSNTRIENLWPLSELIDLQYLNCSSTSVSSCDPLRDLTNLEYLDLSQTGISDIQCISRIKDLKELHIANTSVSTINVFGQCHLNVIYADETAVNIYEVIAFKEVNPDATIVYQSQDLQSWWAGLASPWKDVFRTTAGIKDSPDNEDLQRIADITEIDLSGSKGLGDLSPLTKLYLLHTLKMDDIQIANLEPISGMLTIKHLNISNNPVDDLSAIGGLLNLEELEFKNTQVDDIALISGLSKLKVLDMAGTGIKKMNEVALLTQLEEISFYNTSIKSLSPLEGLTKLKSIKCYNTKLSEKKVNKFLEQRPGLEIVFY